MKSFKHFADRTQAAEALAERLHEYRGRDPLILAIPRGAVPMGKVLAQRLGGELDVVLVHKLSSLFDPEYAIGAVDETGWTYLPGISDTDRADESLMRDIERMKNQQLEALRARRAKYTPFMHSVDPKSRIVIVVDDGLATGATMIAALHAVRSRQPAELICAVPVAASASLTDVVPLADKVVCLHAPKWFGAVSQFYSSFRQVGDEEVLRILASSGPGRLAFNGLPA